MNLREVASLLATVTRILRRESPSEASFASIRSFGIMPGLGLEDMLLALTSLFNGFFRIATYFLYFSSFL